MKKFILLTTVSILLGACGGDGTKDTAKEMSKDTNNTITTEMVAAPVNAEPTPVPAQAQENTPVDPTEIDKQALVDEAKMITKAFGTELKGELQAAMQAGGALNALDVCHTKAMEITDSSSNQHNAQVSRVS